MKLLCLHLRTGSENLILGYEITNPGTKLQTRVQNCKPGYEIANPGTKLQTWVRNYKPEYEITNPGTKLQTRVQNYKPGSEITNLGTKLQTQVQNYKPGYETFNPSAKLVVRDRPYIAYLPTTFFWCTLLSPRQCLPPPPHMYVNNRFVKVWNVERQNVEIQIVDFKMYIDIAVLPYLTHFTQPYQLLPGHHLKPTVGSQPLRGGGCQDESQEFYIWVTFVDMFCKLASTALSRESNILTTYGPSSNWRKFAQSGHPDSKPEFGLHLHRPPKAMKPGEALPSLSFDKTLSIFWGILDVPSKRV
jgi:hypothetical protein